MDPSDNRGWWHSAACSAICGSTALGGAVVAQISVAFQQRVRNRQPDGGFSGDGTSPLSRIRSLRSALSSFGAADTPSARKMRAALAILEELAPGLEVEGEMQGDAALSEEIRMRVFPSSRLKGEANLLIMPTLDAANIAFNLLKTAAGDGLTVGPILLGAARPVHIMTTSATVRRIVNMTALTVVDVISQRGEQKRLL